MNRQTSWCVDHVQSQVAVAAVLLFVMVAALSESYHSNTHPQIIHKIRIASFLSQTSSKNISAAHEACHLWSEMLHPECPDPLPESIQAVSHILHASCLVRVGNDEEATIAFERAEGMQNILDQETREKIVIGKASSLQRLMKYREAMEQFCRGSSPQAIAGAATCALRVGNVSMALNVLETSKNSNHPSVISMKETLKWIRRERQEILQTKSKRALGGSVLGRWIISLESGEGPTCPQECSAVELALTNIGPFDDPLLFSLDDKISLHRLLEGFSFWPHGLVLPDDSWKLQTIPNDCFWMKKRRSGYGSHGNEIVRNSQVSSLSDVALLQKLIDPSFLLDGRKFSIRVYVVYFLPLSNGAISDIFIPHDGLVKLAAKPVDTNPSLEPDSDIYMTNSGRGMTMRQEPLTFLEYVINNRNHSFGYLWDNITAAVQDVMQAYENDIVAKAHFTLQNYRESLGRMGLPKILGFDFVVDADCRPWLVEVNRFPGLEPRDSVDGAIKNEVLRNAWVMAAARLKGNKTKSTN
ncbi:hypothetical protein ACA910_000799 [Epithemia clementina (nom. ined.)]